ncbi:MAG: hypothetical protein CML05_04840 [Pseudozobellia sp.]|nr:hypothetical protein [Pseudozobellia sp.]|tara:strand:- start:384 stop:653 length:270 start_codon:yes stop_codon:yes gene_type:complete
MKNEKEVNSKKIDEQKTDNRSPSENSDENRLFLVKGERLDFTSGKTTSYKNKSLVGTKNLMDKKSKLYSQGGESKNGLEKSQSRKVKKG